MLCLKALPLFSSGKVSRDHWSTVCLKLHRDKNHLSDLFSTNTGFWLPLPMCPNVSPSLFLVGFPFFKAFCLPLEDDDNSIVYGVYMNVASDMADMPHNATQRDIGSQARYHPIYYDLDSI